MSTRILSQTLPNKQDISVWAPADIKVDANAKEYNNMFNAHNKATNIFYTICNDAQNLYLITYITDQTTLLYKAMTGGITFEVNYNNYDVAIRYPAFEKNTRFTVTLPRRGEVPSIRETDSVIKNDNILFTAKANEIEVKGIKNVDTLISIYNDLGIKAAGRFDNKQGYVYEMSIPLKYLNGLLGKTSTLRYHILLNAGENRYTADISKIPRVTRGFHADGSPMSAAEVDNANANTIAGLYNRYASTDFSGEYTLAIKP